jgi:hypothetical protein
MLKMKPKLHTASGLARPSPQMRNSGCAPFTVYFASFSCISSKRIISLCPAVVSPYCCVQHTSDISIATQGLAEQFRAVTKRDPNVIQGKSIFSLHCSHGQTNTIDRNIYEKPAASIFRADSSRWRMHHVWKVGINLTDYRSHWLHNRNTYTPEGPLFGSEICRAWRGKV